jgi:signal transduction histidine kinase
MNMLASSTAYDIAKERGLEDFQRAMLNLLEDFDAEKKRRELVQTSMLNLLEDFAEEKTRFVRMQSATLNILDDADAEKQRLKMLQPSMLNILEDFSEEKARFVQMQTATLNILDDSEAEKTLLKQHQRAFLNILEDIEFEKDKVADACAVNKELQEFAYAASHDLKAPLRVIDNASKWLEEDLAAHLTDESRDNMNLLRGRVRRMEKLLDDLLEYSRIGRKTDNRYAEIIAGDDLMDNILHLLSPPKCFAVHISPSFADIHVHRMPLQQILMNLIGNAIKHHDKKKGCVEVTVEDCGAHYAFAVKDDGAGIPAQFHDQIFGMFQTLKPKDQVEGSGMGLAMVRKYVEVFGGTLNLESSEGKGSIFSFTWPKQQRHVMAGV